MQKRIIAFLMFAAVILLAACSKESSDESGIEDNTPVTGVEKKIIGGWPELGDDGITFMKNGVALYTAYDGYNNQERLKVGHWVYDEETKVLTTDIKDRYGNVLMWSISLLQDMAMAGIQLWNSKTFSASKDIEQAVKNILDNRRSWTRDKNGRLLTIHFSISNNSIRYYFGWDADFWIGYDHFGYSQPDLNTIEINSREYGRHIIHNPYNNDAVYFEFPDGRLYYPVKDGMEDITSVNMSKEESLLVGKWICKQQIWDGKAPGSIYLEDEYGMEFSDMYRGKMWSGDDELMETQFEQKFSWFIKNNILYIDNDHYYILKLNDQEMELEWRDGGNRITCSFYKLNENGDNILANTLEYVDLGLSVKWATNNLGATNDDIAGDFYAWGETSSKETFTTSNYKYFKKRSWGYWPGLTKYCSDPHLACSDEYIDNKMNLEDMDDAVIVNKGKGWRMPTNGEFKELIENCTLEQTRIKGEYGLKVTGKTGYYIFLPFNGYMSAKGLDYSSVSVYGCYLTNSCGIESGADDVPPVQYIRLSSSNNNFTNCLAKGWRSNGYNIRPVHE